MYQEHRLAILDQVSGLDTVNPLCTGFPVFKFYPVKFPLIIDDIFNVTLPGQNGIWVKPRNYNKGISEKV